MKVIIFRLKNLALLAFFLTNIISITEVHGNFQSTNPMIIEGLVAGNFGEMGSTIFSFRGFFPSEWNTTLPVPLEYSYNFRDQSVNRDIYFQLSFVVDFFNSENKLCYQDILTVFSYKNTGYEFFDQFTRITTWNLSVKDTEIPSGDIWEGIVYMTGNVTLGSITYTNSSNSWNITYLNTINAGKQIKGDIIHPIFAIMIIILLLRKKD